MKNNSPEYERVSSTIINEVDDGRLKPGDQLDSIRGYAARFNTSQTTVQRAFENLEQKGYIETAPGKRARVSYLVGKTAPDSTTWKVFWSYARKDDELEKGRISQLRQDIQAEYQLQTGDELNIFQDTQNILWGENWRKSIVENLGVTKFFIPILTPTYLRRPNCLGELKVAIQQFEDLGLDEGIYPIEYIDIERQLEKMEDDRVASFLSNRQRIRDWRELRFEDPSSSAYRKGIREIVQVLIRKDEQMQGAITKLEETSLETQTIIESDDTPGLLEQISDIDQQSTGLNECLYAISNELYEMTSEIKSMQIPNNMKPKEALALTGSLSAMLTPYSDKLKELGALYRSKLQDFDKSISSAIELASWSSSKTEVRSMYESVQQLQAASQTAFAKIDDFSKVLMQMESLSRQLRKPCRIIRTTMEDIAASSRYFDNWSAALLKLNNEQHVD